jgi:predicted RNA-binding Zn-ribbon protein involved in translation (DUF1610 family)
MESYRQEFIYPTVKHRARTMRRQPTNPCPTCGAAARIQVSPDNRGNAQYACARCGTIQTPLPYPTEGGNYIQNPTPVRQGMKAMIGGKEYITVGMIRYEEPEDEGGVSVWYEFVLLNPDNDVRYLEYDPGRAGAEQWTMTEPFAPMEGGALVGVFGAGEGSLHQINNHTFKIVESGTGTVAGFAGQIPWPIRLGEQIQYADMENGPQFVSGEISPDGEMEWFRGIRLNDREVLTHFGQQHLVTELNRREERQKGQSSFGCLTMLVAILAFFLAGMSGCNKGKIIASGSLPASQIDSEVGRRFGPYKLTQANRVYRLRVSTSLSSSSMVVQGVIENADASPFFDVDGELWDESGYDSDGSWHESELNVAREFRLDQPKEVYVRLYADPEAQAANAPVSFALEEGVMHWGPLVIFGVAGSVIGFIWLCIAGSSKKVWDGMS